MENNEIINVQMTKEVYEEKMNGQGGNNDGNGNNTIVYYDVRSLSLSSSEWTQLICVCTVIKASINSARVKAIGASALYFFAPESYRKVYEVGIDLNYRTRIYGDEDYLMTAEEVLKYYDLFDLITSCPIIQEEVFFKM